MTPKTLTRTLIQGTAGAIEVAVNTPTPHHQPPRGVALIAAPNPREGGTLDNKIVTTLAKTYFSFDFIVGRFNYRGVGGSAGAWSDGIGETEDALAVLHYLLSLYHEATAAAQVAHGETAPIIALGGFSFGGAVQSHVAATLAADATWHPRLQLMSLVAPAAKRFAALPLLPVAPTLPETLVVHGEKDDVIPLADALEWASPQRLPIVVFPDCGHFFHGRLIDLQRTVTQYIRARMAEAEHQ